MPGDDGLTPRVCQAIRGGWPGHYRYPLQTAIQTPLRSTINCLTAITRSDLLNSAPHDMICFMAVRLAVSEEHIIQDYKLFKTIFRPPEQLVRDYQESIYKLCYLRHMKCCVLCCGVLSDNLVFDILERETCFICHIFVIVSI